MEFVRCESVKHGITSELLLFFEHLQLSLITGGEISSKISEALRLCKRKDPIFLCSSFDINGHNR